MSGRSVHLTTLLSWASLTKRLTSTVKPVLSGHSKIDKTKVLKTDASLMQVESIAECSLWTCSKGSSVLKNNFWSFEWLLKTGFTVLRAHKRTKVARLLPTCSSAQSDQSSMGALWIAKGLTFFRWKTKALIRLCECADCLLNAHATRYRLICTLC